MTVAVPIVRGSTALNETAGMEIQQHMKSGHETHAPRCFMRGNGADQICLGFGRERRALPGMLSGFSGDPAIAYDRLTLSR